MKKPLYRLTKTKLEKLLYIHNCKVDKIVNGACNELDAVLFMLVEAPKFKPSEKQKKAIIDLNNHLAMRLKTPMLDRISLNARASADRRGHNADVDAYSVVYNYARV